MEILSLLFLIVLLAYFWFTFSIIFHFIRFGVGREPKILALIFFMGSFLLLVATIIFYSRINLSDFKNLF